jgi:hypothetical protein
MPAEPEDRWVFYRGLVERSWGDPDFYQGMVTDPHATLEAEEIELLPGEEISIVDDGHGQKYFLLVDVETKILIC